MTTSGAPAGAAHVVVAGSRRRTAPGPLEQLGGGLDRPSSTLARRDAASRHRRRPSDARPRRRAARSASSASPVEVAQRSQPHAHDVPDVQPLLTRRHVGRQARHRTRRCTALGHEHACRLLRPAICRAPTAPARKSLCLLDDAARAVSAVRRTSSVDSGVGHVRAIVERSPMHQSRLVGQHMWRAKLARRRARSSETRRCRDSVVSADRHRPDALAYASNARARRMLRPQVGVAPRRAGRSPARSAPSRGS